MSQFRIVHSAVHAAIAGLCWLIFSHLDDFKQFVVNSQYKTLMLPALLFGLALLFRLSDALSNAIVENIPVLSALLRRALSGSEFVEGDWPLAVVDMEKQALLYLGFLRITFKNGQTYVIGDDWTPDGNHAHGFHSVQSLCRDHMLRYWYEQGASRHEPDMRGYTEIYFFPKGEIAQRHAGKFLDPKHTTDIRFYAVRQSYRFGSRRLRSAEEKINAARELWLTIAPKLSRLQSQKISSDFA